MFPICHFIHGKTMPSIYLRQALQKKFPTWRVSCVVWSQCKFSFWPLQSSPLFHLYLTWHIEMDQLMSTVVVCRDGPKVWFWI
ncbi:hypothetical protein GUJ93_ZPchr0013g37389 [Zizania palustris]|uniref:Uncharacterized protein n=1 Tax=Zizania palustris TaxID=103762 RepID=A0A8J5WWV0_ZIZPA|nr:hypothetical protein GUJ93_ZPchr0013g37389 [Zizania palustris]